MIGCIKIFIFTITIFFIINYMIFENIVPKQLVFNYLLEKFDLKMPVFPNIPKTIILENNDEIYFNKFKFTHFNQSQHEMINEDDLLQNIQIFNNNLQKIQGLNLNVIYNCVILILSVVFGIFLNVISESVKLIYPLESTNRKIDIHIINYNNFTELLRERLDGINERFDHNNSRFENLQNQIEFLQNQINNFGKNNLDTRYINLSQHLSKN